MNIITKINIKEDTNQTVQMSNNLYLNFKQY